MSILIDQNTKYIIQGITGKEGQRAAEFMLAAGSIIIGGVRPGKAGEEIEGIKVFDTVEEAIGSGVASQRLLENTCSVLTVPPQFVKDAAKEAIDAGIPLIVPIAEGVPVHDTAWIYAYATEKGSRIIGPNTVGLISPGQSKAGVIGGLYNRVFSPGPVGLISKSGGMTSETARLLTQAGIGQSTCINIGGDRMIGTDFVDCLSLFEADEQTKAVVMFGEIGGRYEEEAAEFIKREKFNKPVVAFITGQFAEKWRDMPLGHAGAIIEGSQGTRRSKVQALESAGVKVVDVHHELVKGVQESL